MILLYLHTFPEKIILWNDGWKHNKAPSLVKMFEAIKNNIDTNTKLKGFEMTAHLNSLVHGKPDSALWNIVKIEDNKFGHTPSKIINNAKLCDGLCSEVVPFLVIIVSMVCAYFPETEAKDIKK